MLGRLGSGFKESGFRALGAYGFRIEVQNSLLGGWSWVRRVLWP